MTMTRDEAIRYAVSLAFQQSKDMGLSDSDDSVTWLAKCVRAAGISFPTTKAKALAEFTRLGYETFDRQHPRNLRTYVKNPDFKPRSDTL